MIKYSYLFFLFLLTAAILPAQPDTYLFYHKTYTTDDGLASRYIEDIYQDSRNFIWVSSDYGVDRFDGQKFKVYNQGKYKLHSDNINKIREDQAGNIWFISRDIHYENKVLHWKRVTIDILDQQQDKVISVKEFFTEQPPFLWSEVICISQDSAYVLWITTSNGKVYRYTDRFTEVSLAFGPKEQGILYSLSDSGFLILEPGKIRKLNAKLQLSYQVEFPDRIKEVFSSDDGTVYFMEYDTRQFYKISPEGHIGLFQEKNKMTGSSISNRFGIDARGRLWKEGSDNRLSIYEEEQMIEHEDLNQFSLLDNANSRIAFVGDKDGGMWSSDINGLNYLNFNKSSFVPYMNNAQISMRELFKLTDSTFFTNTYSGYFTLNKNTGDFKPYKLEGGQNFSQGGILWNGYLYNSMYGESVMKINLAAHTHEKILFNIDEEEDASFISKVFTAAPDGLILIGTTKGLYSLNPVTDSIVAYDQYNEFDELKNIVINSFNQAGDQLHISTANGLFVLDWQKGIVAYHEFDFNHLLYLYQDDEGMNWIATRGGGLLEWHPGKDSVVYQYTTEQGFSHDIVYAVYEGVNDDLWLPSSKGLMCFNKKNKKIITYFETNGLTNNEFNLYAHFQDTDGTLYLGGVNGIISFDPKKIRQFPETDSSSPITITDITVTRNDNKTYDLPVQKINDGATLILEGDVQSASIKFALLDYDRLESSQFFYKIKGIHDVWQPMNDGYVRTSGLPGGIYTIDIMVHAGIKLQTHYASLQVEVLRPFTETWLFFGLCALGFLVLGVSLSRYRIYRLDQINQQLEMKVKSRTKKIEDDKILISRQYREMEQINKTKDHLIAIIGHDLKDYVSTFEGIEQKINYLIRSKQVERIPHLAEFIENSAHDLSLLLDNLLNWALKERGDLLLHPDSVSVQSILQDVLGRLDKLIIKKEIELIVKIPDDLRVYVDGLTLHSLLRNIIHNAIKFSHRKGIVKIYHKEKDDFVSLYVEDHGVGMSTDQLNQVLTDKEEVISTRGTENEAGTGMGLLLCREMLEMQSGTLAASSNPDQGTTFSIRLPNKIGSAQLEKLNV